MTEDNMVSYHILVVEDDKAILEGISIYLRNQGYQVFKASNGIEGLEIIEKEKCFCRGNNI
jgi:two-component system, OmpR family, response regulator VanR